MECLSLSIHELLSTLLQIQIQTSTPSALPAVYVAARTLRFRVVGLWCQRNDE